MSGDFCTVSTPRANKSHTCVECRRAIARGMKHARIAGATDGAAWAERMCLDCLALSEEVWALLRADNLNPEDGPRFGGLAAWIRENGEEERLSPEGRDRLARIASGP